ncbi:uncharacterized protein LOC134246210 [Saccostrea cucullata]|uniref:uncharacterized protein LOC134246210 n=1 Tax=Saccostrea cuccullata TaxID=36930 RepID=UPI002ED10CAD
MANSSENPEKLRECLRNGTLSLRDLENKKKRGSSGGRRRRSKSKKGGNITTDDATKTQAEGNPRSTPQATNISKPSKTESSSKNAEKGLRWKTQNNESEMVVRSILDELFDRVTRIYSATEYSDAKEIRKMTPALLGASDKRIVATKNIYAKQRRATLVLLNKAAQENVSDLITRATTRRYDFPSLFSSNEGQFVTTSLLRSANDDLRQRAYQELLYNEKIKIQKIKNMTTSEIEQYFLNFPATRSKFEEARIMATQEFYENEKKINQKLLYKSAQECVNDLIIQASHNYNIAGSVKIDVDIPTLVRSEEYTTRLKALLEKTNAEKLAMQKIMYNTALEVVEDLFTGAASLQTSSEADVNNELVRTL